MMTVILINSWRWFPFVAVLLLAASSAFRRTSTRPRRSTALRPGSASATSPGRSSSRRSSSSAIVGTLLSFNVFDVIWLLTAGGPGSATTTLPVLIYQTAFKAYRLSDAAAMSVVATVLLMGFAIAATRALAPKEDR